MQLNTGAPFSWPVRVYYEDTDAGGVVFYANYLKFFERARTEWLRSGGIDQSQLAESDNLMFVVVHTAVDYHSPAKLDDELKLSVRVEKLARASVGFVQQAWRVGTEASAAPGNAQPHVPTESSCLLATGRIRVACVNRHTLRPTAIPDRIRRFAGTQGQA